MTTALTIFGGGVAVFAVLAWLALRAARRQGQAEAERAAQARTIDNAKKRNESDDAMARLHPDERRRALSEWVSDGE